MGDSAFNERRLNMIAFETRRKASFSKLCIDTPLNRCAAAVWASEGEDADTPVTAEQELMWKLMDKYLSSDQATIQRAIVTHVEYTLSRNRFNMDEESCYRAAAYSIRDRLIEMFNDTNAIFFQRDVKRCYYMSLEFLIGRAMQNALVNLDIESQYKDALSELGYKLETLYEYEHDAGLGNGGLGRLAACFLDSMATLNYPCWGYGIRYTYGIFEQKIVNGWQCEYPDYWLVQDNPWEIYRPDVTYAVRFGGSVRHYTDDRGHFRCQWVGGSIVQAVAYDNPVPGFDTFNCLNLRLWRAVPSKEFDFSSFNQGNYMDAIKERQEAECISAVLYPNDETAQGKELRLKQQYFFVSASIQDALRRFKKAAKSRNNKSNTSKSNWNSNEKSSPVLIGRDWKELPEKVAFQLNDTHPTIGIPELIRILVDVEALDWDVAVNLTYNVFHYTNHTVLPEALEKWPAELIGKLLPRHLEIINELNYRWVQTIQKKWGAASDKVMKMSIYEDGWTKLIRMANLAVVGSNRVNGVAAIHSDLVKRDLFPSFVEWYRQTGEPDKFLNVTNGVTTRRWVHNSNRLLSNLISRWLGSDEWLKNHHLTAGLVNHLSEPNLLKEWAETKHKNKERLCKWVKHFGGPELNPEMIFDIQTKRIHEYKRQHLFAFYMLHRYLAIKKMSPEMRASQIVPRACLVGGKAAPGYATAKTIIKMINSIAEVVNNDPDVSPFLKVFFLPNYNVSSAAIIIPASDVNEQISTAGTEASGTSNMKYVMNGSLIVGTMDGANVEIVEEGGLDTAFIFGAREGEVGKVRANAKRGNYPVDQRLWDVFNFIRNGSLARGDHEAQKQFCRLIDTLLKNGDGHNGDFYLVCHDFPSYVNSQHLVDQAFKNKSLWTKTSIKAAAATGKFSTDVTIRNYAQKIWNIKPCEVTRPSAAQIRRLQSRTLLQQLQGRAASAQPSQQSRHSHTQQSLHHTHGPIIDAETKSAIPTSLPLETVTEPTTCVTEARVEVTTGTSTEEKKAASISPDEGEIDRMLESHIIV